MKFTGMFLVLLILVLNGLPCCGDDCNEEASTGEHTGSSTSGELCSPFYSCGSCAGFVYYNTLPVLPSPNPVVKKRISLLLKENYSEYINHIWQPPRNK